MIADVPLGAFLSGGVDSSAIVALMKRYASAPVRTFSLGFPIGGAYNELSDARQVAEFLGTEHYELQVDSVDLVQTLRKLVYHYDEPFGDAAGFPVYLLSQYNTNASRTNLRLNKLCLSFQLLMSLSNHHFALYTLPYGYPDRKQIQQVLHLKLGNCNSCFLWLR